jgi:hypothetical protein
MSPTRIALLGIATYLVLFIVAPVHVVITQSLLPYLYIALCYGAFFAGCFLARSQGRALAHKFSDDQLRTIHRVTTIVASIGALLKLTDLFIVRGVSLGGTFLDRRNEMDTVGANPVSIVCAVLLPACLLVPFTWQLLRERKLTTLTQTILTHALLSVPVLGAVMITGGRSQLVIYAVVYMIYSIYLGRMRFRPKVLLGVVAGGLVLMVISIAIFNSRLESLHMKPLTSIYSSGYAYTLQPQDWIAGVVDRNQGIIGNFAFALLVTCQYYLHGVFEFVFQMQNAPAEHIWGAASFNAYYKFLAYFMGWPSPDDLWFAVTVRRGIYTTFFGPVFSDFGWFGLPYLLAFGVLAQRLWETARFGRFAALPLYAYVMYLIFLFPVTNGVTGNQGLYTLTAFAGFLLFMPRAPQQEKARRAFEGKRE